MEILKERSKRVIKSLLYQKTKSLKSEEARELTKQLKQAIPGSIDQMKLRDDLIVGHINLIARIAISCKVHDGILRDKLDILSEGLEQLIMCVDRVAAGVACQDHDNISAYIHMTVRYNLYKFVRSNLFPIVIPDWRSYAYIVEFFKPLEDDAEELLEADESYYTIAQKTYKELQVQPDTQSLVIEQIVNCGIFTSREKIIICLRAEGSTVAEIGETLGLTHQMISLALKRIYEKFQLLKREGCV